jgi:hypothetical protein
MGSCGGNSPRGAIVSAADSFYADLRSSRVQSARSLVCKERRTEFDEESEELVRLARAFSHVNSIPRSTATQIDVVEVGVSFVSSGGETHIYIPVSFESGWKLCPVAAAELVPR